MPSGSYPKNPVLGHDPADTEVRPPRGSIAPHPAAGGRSPANELLEREVDPALAGVELLDEFVAGRVHAEEALGEGVQLGRVPRQRMGLTVLEYLQAVFEAAKEKVIGSPLDGSSFGDQAGLPEFDDGAERIGIEKFRGVAMLSRTALAGRRRSSSGRTRARKSAPTARSPAIGRALSRACTSHGEASLR